jgi:hypothetical protein
MVLKENPAAWRAPVRRPVALRPRAPRPPGRGADHPLSSFGRFVTRLVRPLQHTPPGKAMQRLLRRSCDLRDIEIQLGRGGADLDGFRVALLSDLHVGFFFSEAELADLARRVSAWSPDLICLGAIWLITSATNFSGWARGSATCALEKPWSRFPETMITMRSPICGFFARSSRMPASFRCGIAGCVLQRGSSSLWVAGLDDLTAGRPRS